MSYSLTGKKKNVVSVGNSKIFIRKDEDFLNEEDFDSIQGISYSKLDDYIRDYGVLTNYGKLSSNVGEYRNVVVESIVGREIIASIPNTYETVILPSKNTSFNVGDNVYLLLSDVDKNGNFIGDLSSGLKRSVINKIEDVRTGKNEDVVFDAKILSKNNGGFFIEVDKHYKGFMPGSVASMTQILNYDSMIGKEVKVMISSFENGSPVFSNKKYIDESIKDNIKLLNRSEMYKGVVTGIQNFGIFVQWDGIYTGLLHQTEYSERFKDSVLPTLKKGGELSFYIKKIDNGDKIILTTKESSIITGKLLEYFKQTIEEGTILAVDVKRVVQSGVIVDVCEGLESFVYISDDYIDDYTQGDKIKVVVSKIQPMKDFLKLNIHLE